MATPTSYRPEPFPAPVRQRLVEVLAEEHAAAPFGPSDVRGGVRRVVGLVEQLGMEVVVVRGGVDLGGAELDHVFAVVEGRVVDVVLPVRDVRFLRAVRAWVAGDLPTQDLASRAATYGIEDRVLGEFPAAVGYRGAPVWGTAA